MKLKIFQNNSLIEFLQGHKIKNSSGTALTQRESLKFTGDVTVTDDSSNDQTIVNITGGGSGGHTILNGSGSAMTARSKLQLEGGAVKDDSSNDKTVFTVAKELTQAQYDALSSSEKNNGTTYYIPDAPSSYTGVPQSMIGDAWVLGHAYVVGDYSIDANGLYKNGTAHTSTATNRPSVNQSGYWTLVSVASQLGFNYTYLDTVSVTATAGQTKSNVKNVNIDVSKYKYFILDYDVGGEKFSGFFINLYNNSSSNPDMYVRNYNPDTNYGNRATAQVNVANGYMKKLEVGIVNHATQISRTCTLKVYGLQ